LAAPMPSAEAPPVDRPPVRHITEAELADFLSAFTG
jgi:hypothetical protein